MTPCGPLRRAIDRAPVWLRDRLHLTPTLRVAGTSPHVLDLPDVLSRREVIVVGEDPTQPQWLAFDCPCRQGHRLLINLSWSRRPRWTLHQDDRDRVTLHPSVDSFSEVGRCHFWLRRGRVTWVKARNARTSGTVPR